MKAIRLEFLTGRFHATPWGRNVNEGVVEWPPSPFRLARALIDKARRRHADWDDERVAGAIEPLAGAPRFVLPPASASHVRFFMSSNDRNPTKRQKIFDAFVVLSRDDAVLLAFHPDAPMDDGRMSDLAVLLGELNYLGRSESWVRAELVDQPEDLEVNCVPADGPWTLQGPGERVPVVGLRPPGSYVELAIRPTEGRGKKQRDLSWLEAVSMPTDAILKQGWSLHPGLLSLDYVRPSGCLNAKVRASTRPAVEPFRFARFSLSSKVLPLVEDTVPFAERVRSHLMGIHKAIQGGDPEQVSALFSGKDGKDGPARGHRHAFIVPRDEDRDGRLDHLEIWSSQPLEESELHTLGSLNSVWQPNRRPDVEFLLTTLLPERPQMRSKTWESATPFVTARHHRKGRGEFLDWLASDLARELEIHGLPSPSEVLWIPATTGVPSPVRWASFVRSRKGARPASGFGARIRFEEDVEGPFAVGSLCHYGLGVFVPADRVR